MSTAGIVIDDLVGRLYVSEMGDGKVVALRSIGVAGRDASGTPTVYTMATVRDDHNPGSLGDKRMVSVEALAAWREWDDKEIPASGALAAA